MDNFLGALQQLRVDRGQRPHDARRLELGVGKQQRRGRRDLSDDLLPLFPGQWRPVEDLVAIFMTQLIPSYTFNFRGQLKSIIYSSIVE